MPSISDDLGELLGTKPKSQVVAPAAPPSAIQTDLQAILGRERPEVDKKKPSAEDWGPWLNMFDEFMLGQARGLIPTGPKAPGPIVARKPENLTPAEVQLLKQHAQKQTVNDAKHAWEAENPALAAITSILATLPASVGAAGLVQRGVTAPLMGTRLAPLAEFTSGGAGRGVAGMKGAIERAGSQTASGALGGAGNALMTSATSDRPAGEQVQSGAIIGGLLGPVAGAVGNRLGSQITPREAKIAQDLAAQGVNLRPGQLPGVAPLTKLLDKMFGNDKKQTEDFVGALTKTMGSNAKEIDQATINEARKRIGDTLNQAAARTFIPNSDPTFGRSLQDLVTRASIDLPTDDFKGKFVPIIQRIAKEMASGGISGDVYKSMTQEGSALATATARTSPIRFYAVQAKRALDEALERANPAAAAEIKQARHQWHNSMIIEDLYDEATGKVDPSKLQRIVEREYGSAAKASQKAQSTGQQTDIGKLAQGGTMMGPPKEGDPSFWKKMFAGTMPIAGGVSLADMLHGSSILPTLLSDPSRAAVLAAGGAAGYGAMRGANALMNGPTMMDRLLSSATGQQPSLLRNRLTGMPINPSIPAAQQLYETLNRAGEQRMTPEGYPYVQAQ